ncbi:hypothetical protein BKA62DRAFT_834371 [Auriculariales sp. MPI-PUGE-AT-0066]|nr:hypothetical protein BKA62DRAFT_834371 [Auriculariales sp. MPI-PUGE-AT-0066]
MTRGLKLSVSRGRGGKPRRPTSDTKTHALSVLKPMGDAPPENAPQPSFKILIKVPTLQAGDSTTTAKKNDRNHKRHSPGPLYDYEDPDFEEDSPELESSSPAAQKTVAQKKRHVRYVDDHDNSPGLVDARIFLLFQSHEVLTIAKLPDSVGETKIPSTRKDHVLRGGHGYRWEQVSSHRRGEEGEFWKHVDKTSDRHARMLARKKAVAVHQAMSRADQSPDSVGQQEPIPNLLVTDRPASPQPKTFIEACADVAVDSTHDATDHSGGPAEHADAQGVELSASTQPGASADGIRLGSNIGNDGADDDEDDSKKPPRHLPSGHEVPAIYLDDEEDDENEDSGAITADVLFDPVTDHPYEPVLSTSKSRAFIEDLFDNFSLHDPQEDDELELTAAARPEGGYAKGPLTNEARDEIDAIRKVMERDLAAVAVKYKKPPRLVVRQARQGLPGGRSSNASNLFSKKWSFENPKRQGESFAEYRQRFLAAYRAIRPTTDQDMDKFKRELIDWNQNYEKEHAKVTAEEGNGWKIMLQARLEFEELAYHYYSMHDIAVFGGLASLRHGDHNAQRAQSLFSSVPATRKWLEQQGASIVTALDQFRWVAIGHQQGEKAVRDYRRDEVENVLHERTGTVAKAAIRTMLKHWCSNSLGVAYTVAPWATFFFDLINARKVVKGWPRGVDLILPGGYIVEVAPQRRIFWKHWARQQRTQEKTLEGDDDPPLEDARMIRCEPLNPEQVETLLDLARISEHASIPLWVDEDGKVLVSYGDALPYAALRSRPPQYLSKQEASGRIQHYFDRLSMKVASKPIKAPARCSPFTNALDQPSPPGGSTTDNVQSALTPATAPDPSTSKRSLDDAHLADINPVHAKRSRTLDDRQGAAKHRGSGRALRAKGTRGDSRGGGRGGGRGGRPQQVGGGVQQLVRQPAVWPKQDFLDIDTHHFDQQWFTNQPQYDVQQHHSADYADDQLQYPAEFTDDQQQYVADYTADQQQYPEHDQQPLQYSDNEQYDGYQPDQQYDTQRDSFDQIAYEDDAPESQWGGYAQSWSNDTLAYLQDRPYGATQNVGYGATRSGPSRRPFMTSQRGRPGHQHPARANQQVPYRQIQQPLPRARMPAPQQVRSAHMSPPRQLRVPPQQPRAPSQQFRPQPQRPRTQLQQPRSQPHQPRPRLVGGGTRNRAGANIFDMAAETTDPISAGQMRAGSMSGVPVLPGGPMGTSATALVPNHQAFRNDNSQIGHNASHGTLSMGAQFNALSPNISMAPISLGVTASPIPGAQPSTSNLIHAGAAVNLPGLSNMFDAGVNDDSFSSFSMEPSPAPNSYATDDGQSAASTSWDPINLNM